MHYQYKTQGVCASQLQFDLEGGRIHNVSFTGGCNGNLLIVLFAKKAKSVWALPFCFCCQGGHALSALASGCQSIQCGKPSHSVEPASFKLAKSHTL